MRLIEFSVRNYRSITNQAKVELGDQTTLVGPNNEGKSNILRAVALGMELIEGWSRLPPSVAARSAQQGVVASALQWKGGPRSSSWGDARGSLWDWERDFPLAKQGASGVQPTMMRLRFSLSEGEVTELQQATGIRCNRDLPVELTLRRDRISLGIVKQGRGAASFRAKAQAIASFISDRIEFVNVQAVRTSDQARSLVDELVRERILELSKSDEYRDLLEKIAVLQRDAIVPLAESVTESVRRYLPAIERVEIEQADIQRSFGVSDLIVDDGVRTSLTAKGDGIKSLLTMALIHELTSLRHSNRTLILAVDEPEAHLHPRAIHELDAVLRELSTRQQVILATHNPIFVNRASVRSNILVERNAAKVAANLTQIRKAIGVQLQDNLESSEVVVMVEGHTDSQLLPLLMAAMDDEWSKRSLKERVVFKAATGVGKMPTHISREKSTVCRIFVVLDDDEAGRNEAKRLNEVRLIPTEDVFMLGLAGRRESELEDLLDPASYLEALSEQFKRTFTEGHFKNPQRKWSGNFTAAAQSLGVAGEKRLLVDSAKVTVARAVAASGNAKRLRPEATETVRALSDLITSALG